MTVRGVDGRLYKDQASADKAAARMANAPVLDGSSTSTQVSTPTTKTSTTSTPTTSTSTSTGNQWSSTNYKDSDGYYSGTERNAATEGAEFGTTPKVTETKVETPKAETPKVETPTDDYGERLRKQWEGLTYAQQQKVMQNESFKNSMAKYGLTPKTQEEAPKTEETTTTPTKGEGWDYQDNSPERMAEIADNVNRFAISDPDLFANEDAFRNFFIDGKGRTPEQEKFLMDFYKNRKMYNKLDTYTSDQIGNMYVNGEIPDSYLNYLKNTNPDRYAYVMDAKAAATDKIKDKASLDTINNIEGDSEDTSTAKVIEWLKAQGLLVDKDGNLVDDRRENYASEEENTYLKQIADLNARNLEIDNIVKHSYDDYVKAYPGATKATLMAMAQDVNSDLLREKENNLVELTRLQGYVGYMQSERQEMNKAGADTISQLQNLLQSYYKYSPEGISELLQAEYAATNVTLDQADKGTDTQKQMALESVLSPIYETYGAIIERPMAQVINDVMAYAKNKGISLNQALQENFITPLKNKEGYQAYQSSLNAALTNGSWTLEPIKDAKGNITGYVRVNKNTGEIVPYSGTAGAGAASGVYNEKTGVFNYSDAFGYANQDKLGTNLGYKNNNPGNITDSNVGEIGRNGKFAVFETPEDGFDALLQKIQNAQNGLSKNYPATANLYEFFNTYAPSSDNNDPKKYAESVAAQLGVSPYTQIKDLDTFQFAAQIARHDSGYDASTYGMFRGGQQGGGDYYWRSPMDAKFEDAISSAGTQAAKDALAYASTVYSNLYEIASDGSLNQFIESGDFQKIMSNLNTTKALSGDTTRGQSFFNEWIKAVEKSKIIDPNSQRVINVLKNMIEQKLRDESGAAISSSEWLSNFQDYLPQAGEAKDVSLSKMMQWEKNVILKTLQSAGMPKSEYEWLFKPGSQYYKTMDASQYYDTKKGQTSKGTWDIGQGSVASFPSASGGGQFDALFTTLGIG